MFRLQVWVRRLIAAGVPALLLGVLVGCGVQPKPAPEVAQATPEEVKKEPPLEPEAEITRLKKEIERLEKTVVETKKTDSANLQGQNLNGKAMAKMGVGQLKLGTATPSSH